ncbi:MAG: hypothetical protein OEQ53_12610 [Saprospiraceae bacterium]|nr:hypothetical protein [Saprospiraceae bacterium]
MNKFNVFINKILILFIICVTITGCGKEENILFEIPFELRFDIPAGLNPFDKHFFLVRNVQTNIKELRNQFQIDENQPLIIRPASAVLSSTFQDNTYEFLAEIEISLFEDDPDQDIEAFLTENVPVNAGRNVVVVPFETDLSKYIDDQAVNFKISLRLRSTTPSFIESIIEMNFTAE